MKQFIKNTVSEKSIKGKLSKNEKYNRRLGYISLLIGGISLIIGIWGIEEGKNIAEKSGAFDKGELKLKFGGYYLYPYKDLNVYFGVDFSDSSLHFATIPIGIHNFGKKTSEDITLLYEYSNSSNISVKDSIFKMSFVFNDQSSRRLISDNYSDIIKYQLNTLNPNFSVQLGDLICLREETIFNHNATTKTKSNSDVDLNKIKTYSHPLRVILTAKDAISEVYSFNLFFVNETDLNNLLQKVLILNLNESNKQNTPKDFFLIIPTSAEQAIGENFNITVLSSDIRNTIFCQYTKSLEYLNIVDTDMTILKSISLSGRTK